MCLVFAFEKRMLTSKIDISKANHKIKPTNRFDDTYGNEKEKGKKIGREIKRRKYEIQANFRFYEWILNFQNQFNVHAFQAAWLYYLKFCLIFEFVGWFSILFYLDLCTIRILSRKISNFHANDAHTRFIIGYRIYIYAWYKKQKKE